MSRSNRSKRGAKRRRGKFQIPLVIALAVLALAGLGWVLVTARGSAISGRPAGAPAASSAPGQAPAIAVMPAVYDMGTVSQARGIVGVELAVTNEGTGNLVIAEMETSCGCTRATLVVNGRSGPWFGMRGHSDWPRGWSAHLQPGQRATLRVEYDPDAHGIYRGPVDRDVLIYSNDPRRPRVKIRLTGTQVP